MHDTYYYGLVNIMTAVIADRSHSKEMSDTVYRSAASIEECVRVLTTFPKTASENLRRWVVDWVERLRRNTRGAEIPEHENWEAATSLMGASSNGESSKANLQKPAKYKDG